MRLTLLLLFTALTAIAQPPPANIGINSTRVNGGIAPDCLKVNANGTLGQAACGGAGGVTSITAGTGISVNAATGAVTVTNTSPGEAPAGSAGDMQYNAGGGLFGATSGLTWDATSNRLTTSQQYTDLSTNPKSLFSNVGLLDPTDAPSNTTVYGGISSYLHIDDGSGDVGGSVWAGSSIIENDNNRAGKTISHAFAHDFEIDTFGSSVPAEMGGSEVNFLIFAPVTSLYGSWIQSPLLFAGSMPVNFYGHYVSDISGKATNPYYSWFDSQGVRRVKEDSTFNSVGQAIEALYNPQFTKYTPGAVNYERIVIGQWESNVAVITTENGGTGTLRNIQIDGAEVDLGTASHLVNIPAASFKFDGKTCTIVAGAIACS